MKTFSLVSISCCFNIVTVIQCTTTATRTVAFQSQSTRTIIQTRNNNNNNNNIIQLYQTGGWGIGPQREMLPEEFARRSDNKRIFDGYQLSDRGEFMRQVQRDKDLMIQDEISELLGVANIAGITVKDPSERLNKFSMDDIVGDDNDTTILDIDDDDIDLRIQWEDDDDVDTGNSNTTILPDDDEVDSSSSSSSSAYNSRRRKRKSISQIDQNSSNDNENNNTNEDSITRFDEDTGASGVW